MIRPTDNPFAPVKTINTKAWRITAVNYRFLAALIQPLFHWITLFLLALHRTRSPPSCVRACVHGRCLLNKLTARETKGDECRSFSRATTPTFRRNNGSTVVAKIPPHIESQRIIKRKRSRSRRRKEKREHGIMERRHARGPRGTGTENYTVDLIKARGSYGGSTRNFVRGLKVSWRP